jgi:hypothetical protein
MLDSPDFATLITTPAPVDDPAICAGCGEPTIASAPGGWWRLDCRRWHPACAPWAGRPYPLAWAAEAGRKLLGRARRESAPAPPHLARAVDCLEELGRVWLPLDVAPALERAANAAEYVRGCLEIRHAAKTASSPGWR